METMVGSAWRSQRRLLRGGDVQAGQSTGKTVRRVRGNSPVLHGADLQPLMDPVQWALRRDPNSVELSNQGIHWLLKDNKVWLATGAQAASLSLRAESGLEGRASMGEAVAPPEGLANSIHIRFRE